MSMIVASMLSYLNGKVLDYRKEKAQFGENDRIVIKKYDEIVAIKDMIEALVGKEVIVKDDGKVELH